MKAAKLFLPSTQDFKSSLHGRSLKRQLKALNSMYKINITAVVYSGKEEGGDFQASRARG